MSAVLEDTYGRQVRYLRVSVTDRCNLRCLYCAHTLGLTFIPHENILRYEELEYLIGSLTEAGVAKVRFTGGEPFARKGFVPFLANIRRNHPDLDVRVTTNATLLPRYIDELVRIRLDGVNVSFDTFRPETFIHITGVDAYAQARQGLELAIEAGMQVKLNTVALAGINDAELEDFIKFASAHPVDVRFIEFMPLGGRGAWTEKNFWPASDILARACATARLTPVPYLHDQMQHNHGSHKDATGFTAQPTNPSAAKETEKERLYPVGGHGAPTLDSTVARSAPRGEEDGGLLSAPAAQHMQGPARMFSIEGGLGRFGVITPLTSHFCNHCNRLRITAEGAFRPCLFSDREVPFRDVLRDPAQGMPVVLRLLREAMKDKPMGYKLMQARKEGEAIIRRSMSSIGG